MTEDEKRKWADDTIQGMMLSASGGFDPEVASQAMNSALRSLQSICEMLKEEAQKMLLSDKRIELDRLAKCMAHISKSVDGITRLISFSQGQPDHRSENTDSSWTKLLTEAQLAQVQEWVRSNNATS